MQMAHFIVSGNLTAQAMKGMIASPSDCEAAVRGLVEAAGGTIKSYLVTTGDTDFMMIVESDAMDHRRLAALMVAGATGSVGNLKTAQAFTSAGFPVAQKEAGRMAGGFRPTG